MSNDEDQQIKELQLKVLHDLLYEAITFPGLPTAYTNFIRSLRERLHPQGVWKPRLTELESGLKFKLDLGDRLGCDIYYGYYQEYFDSQLFFHLISANSTVLDIGANFGYYAIHAASSVGEKGKVYAFEPNQDAYELLQTNIEINGFQSIIQTYKTCVGAENGEIEFYISEESSFSGLTDTGRSKLKEKITVPICTIDSLDLPPIDAIKIDVEGHEEAVLRGALKTIARSPSLVLMIEVSQKNLSQQQREALKAILEEIYKIGFRGHIVTNLAESMLCLNSAEAVINLGSANVFLTVANSEREQQLQRVYQDLCSKTFQGIARKIDSSEQTLLASNVTDSQEYVKLHQSLLNIVDQDSQTKMQNLQSTINNLKAKVTELEKDNQHQAEKIKRKDEIILELQQVIKGLNIELNRSFLSKILGYIRKLK